MDEVPAIGEERVRIAGIETFLRRREGAGTPTLFVHGNPTHSEDWLPFLAAGPGPAVAIDLPNFGRSERVAPKRFDASMHAYADFIGAAIDELDLDRFNLVAHDWGAIALHPVQRRADRLERLVLIDAVPLLSGYRWHWMARAWRRPLIGELLNRSVTRPAVALLLRQAHPGFRPMPDRFVEMIWERWDWPMARAMLRLYRSADPGALEAAGARLGSLECPALVCWGRQDRFLGPELAAGYAARLPDADTVLLDDAGHWPWIDRPELVDRVSSFLAGEVA